MTNRTPKYGNDDDYADEIMEKVFEFYRKSVTGPTAVIKSCAKMDHLSTGGTLLNQKFTPSVVAGENGLEQMANLVRSYFNLDGHHIQFNVIDRQTLINAQKHPDEYRVLIVRVAGYSDHFRNLDKALQDEIIE